MPEPVYVVQYGRSAFVGAFSGPGSLTRGDTVVVRSPRGLEQGVVLCDLAGSTGIPLDPRAGGEIVRHASDSEAETCPELEQELLAAADEMARDWPIAMVEVELLLDRTAILHVLPWAECNLDPLLTTLSHQFDRTIRLQDVSRMATIPDEPERATTCGKPDCGSGTGGCGTGGGCSTGSCSRGSIRSAADMTAYFADLRQKMEAQDRGRTTLL